MKVIDVNSTELIKFSKKLEQIGKKAVPIAAKQTLNSVAFDVKKNTLSKEASNVFTQRSPSFFKRFSRVSMAKGTNIDRMESAVGMFGKSDAVQNQTQQQLTGSIKNRKLIPLKGARVSNNNKKSVRRKNRLSNVHTVADSKNSSGSTAKKRFVQTAIKAVDKFGSGAVIKHRSSNGKQRLIRIEKGGSNLKTRSGNLKITPIYSVKEGRSVSINKSKPYTLRAGIRSSRKGNKFFEQHARRQLNKYK